uniref:CSN8/PSMD8/EIF3K domain-containing protein n=1 Tax=Sinocyclocheilus grahami TaxID=75366 RepID=A0A672M6T6_SINGR
MSWESRIRTSSTGCWPRCWEILWVRRRPPHTHSLSHTPSHSLTHTPSHKLSVCSGVNVVCLFSVSPVICHVVGITYQNIEYRLLAEMLGDPLDTQVKVWMNKYGWTENEDGQIFIHYQEESVKPKNIVEKIDFESVSSIMATSQ